MIRIIFTSLLFFLTGLPIWRPDLSGPGFDIDSYVRVFAVLWLVWFIFDVWRLWMKTRPRKIRHKGFESVADGVPHARFVRTKEGFKVLLRNRTGYGCAAMVFMLTALWLGGWFLLQGMLPGKLTMTRAVEVGIVACALAYLGLQRRPTKIEVTRNTVIVNRKKLKRSEFGSFVGDNSLGYSYGNENFVFSTEWRKHEGIEIASALNGLLRETPQAGTQHKPPPDDLRNVRPTDF